MVDEKQQTREAILKLITYVCGLPSFDRKREVVETLYTLEWALRPEDEKKEIIDWARDKETETVDDEYEAHWE